ncbi:helix-turn-helix transcriptional regulator [Actinomycetospora termitidis]|uniref:Helix-turn-helix transcriptional regulator n=1 Tax=Actinomycetospora termitidis TaxID=3053470 RepID=A0ABT7M9Z0_9PSEU|nr:helix-turn-helix transcriptional regulator [Actinomycetospora sp. Odt1-22]MDL5157476.1 helix-turn-helix transcriptional regulator [Actinomycetospora sp. Odt1-22]
MTTFDPAAGHVAVRDYAAAALSRIVGHDLAVWATVDPTTVMTTSCRLYGADRDPVFEGEVLASEYADDREVLRYTDLADGALVGTVHDATGGDPARSRRHREVLAPRGFTDHLRLVLHDGRTAWGVVDLLRAGGVFTGTEVAAASQLGRPAALALRVAMTHARARGDDDAVVAAHDVEGSGLVLCGSDGTVSEVSPEARVLLEGAELPAAVTALIAARRGAGHAGPISAPTPSGRWLTFAPTDLGTMTAVVVDPIRPSRLADVVARARGLSAREQDVLAELARGRPNKQIARRLGLSEWTVQDHVKAVLAKFGASGRGELQAALFSGHYAPLHG